MGEHDGMPAFLHLFAGEVRFQKLDLSLPFPHHARGIEGEGTSPTFSIQHCYGEGLYHYDLYRLEHEEFMQMGLFEEFEKPGWHFVEWGSDTLKHFLEDVGYHVTTVEIIPHGENRIYRIEE